jgi:glycosyltransferase involved in cell wall biosynthesis
MRITMIVPEFNLSGGIRVLATYAERLQRRGHQVVALAAPEPPPTWRACIRSFLKGKGWPSSKPPAASHFDGIDVKHYLLDHAGPLSDGDVPDADIVLASWWENVVWLPAFSLSKGARVHFVQGYDALGGPVEQVDAVYRLPLAKIAVSNWLRDLLQSKFQQTPVAIIPNGVDERRFFAPPRGKQDRPTVGMVYNHLAIKGADVALKAYELAVRDLPDLKLVAIGEMPVTRELPLPKGAEFLFRVRDQELRATYSRCDAWLFPSRQEGFGLPILEAMACRTPVIAAPAGAAPELLSGGGGILVPGDDARAMAQAILQVCTASDTQWRGWSDAALATAAAHGWDQSTTRLEQAFQQILQQRSTQASRSCR